MSAYGFLNRQLQKKFLPEHKAWHGPRGVRVPGNLYDKTPTCFRAFDKWYKRPRSSHKLWWRLHK